MERDDKETQRAEALLTPQEAEWLAQMNAVYADQDSSLPDWLTEAGDEALRRSFEDSDSDDD